MICGVCMLLPNSSTLYTAKQLSTDRLCSALNSDSLTTQRKSTVQVSCVVLQGTVLKVLLLSVTQHGWQRDAIDADEAAAALQADGFDPR